MRCRPTTLAPADSHSRPGILVLVNDADWELEGGLAYQLCDNDEVRARRLCFAETSQIVFISTLHGG